MIIGLDDVIKGSKKKTLPENKRKEKCLEWMIMEDISI